MKRLRDFGQTMNKNQKRGEAPRRRSPLAPWVGLVSTSLLLTMSLAGITSGAAPAAAITSGPCEILSSAGTACVAAYSSVRALSSSYAGPLYQVQRASDSQLTDVGLLAVGDYANAAAQDTFCANTICTLIKIYDQTSRHNDLTMGIVGTAGSTDTGVRADSLPIMAGGAQGLRPALQRWNWISSDGRLRYCNKWATGIDVRRHKRNIHLLKRPLLLRLRQCRNHGRRYRQRAYGRSEPL